MTLRILWASDSPIGACDEAHIGPRVASGYAVQTALTAPRLQRAGLAEIALLTTYGLHGAGIVWEGLRVYPGGADPFGNDAIPWAARDWGADVVITLKDAGVFRPETFSGLRWCPMTPIDHEPAPPTVVSLARASYRPIAYAPNGVRSLRVAGLDPLYAPHGYDPATFFPVDRQGAREKLGLPADAFIVGTVAVNRGGLPSRKAWDENIRGVAQFRKATGAKVLYLCHTYAGDDGYEASLPLRQLAADAGVLDAMVFAQPEAYKAGYPPSHLRTMYNAMDVLLATSRGEGFGIPTLEAQACGVPVIAGQWAAQEDLIWGGWGIGRDEATRDRDGQMSYTYIPDPDAIADRLQAAYAASLDPQEAARLRAAALAGAAPYQIDRVIAEHWAPALAELEAMVRRDQRQARGVLRIIRPSEVLSR
jgi:glycosyltransferase involved in cell wall biosynthesis